MAGQARDRRRPRAAFGIAEGNRFVIYTEVLREGFALNRVVVFGSQGDGSEAISEAEFTARRQAGIFEIRPGSINPPGLN